MKNNKRTICYLAGLIILGVLLLAGTYFVYFTVFPSGDIRQNTSSPPEESISSCNPHEAALRTLAPVNTSVPVRDPMPGIRYSLNQNDSGRTIVLGNGDIVEINLRWIPGLGFRWIIPVSGSGIELVNDGYYDTGTDFWNTSGHFRARYRAISPGRSFLDGKFVISPKDDPTTDFQFNLTVIVK